MDWKSKHPGRYAMYFRCQTGLVKSFQTMFANDFTCEGSRAIVFKLSDVIPADAPAYRIETALMYHLRKRSAGRRK